MNRPCRVILSHRKSGLAFGEVEGSDGGFLLTRNADRAELLLVAHDILLKGSQQALGMLWRKNHTTLYLGFGHAWQHTREVDDI